MKIENGFMLGTFEEFLNEITIRVQGVVSERSKFKGIEFSLLPEDTTFKFNRESYVDLVSSNGGLYFSIIPLNTGVENANVLDLFADYYEGSHNGIYKRIFSDDSFYDIRSALKPMVREVIEDTVGELLSKDDLIIAEWL